MGHDASIDSACGSLRETSVILGVLIAAVFLKEHISPLRYLSTLAVTEGAIAIKMS